MDTITAIMFLCPTAKWRFEGGSDYEHLVWEDLFYPKPSLQDLETAWKYVQGGDSSYKFERRKAYPSVEEQLAWIFDYGIEGWRERIQAVKDAIPKQPAVE